ncbi:hypothetical protein [Campylobacter pinnipediorum]|uniref:hypothetical protein n=1 Tax=Campylobacter pinnipediorum TaxID=1965231 RepID=UPI0015D66B6E|nr:hypothetical protein [Campylobacter pinnipediorum]
MSKNMYSQKFDDAILAKSSMIYRPFDNMESAKQYIKNIFVGNEQYISKIKK